MVKTILFLALCLIGEVTKGGEFTIGGYFKDLYHQCGVLRFRLKQDCKKIATNVATDYLKELEEGGIADQRMFRMAKVVQKVCYIGCLQKGRDGKRAIQKGVGEATAILSKKK